MQTSAMKQKANFTGSLLLFFGSCWNYRLAQIVFRKNKQQFMVVGGDAWMEFIELMCSRNVMCLPSI